MKEENSEECDIISDNFCLSHTSDDSACSSDEEFCIIIPDCFDTSKPFSPAYLAERHSMERQYHTPTSHQIVLPLESEWERKHEEMEPNTPTLDTENDLSEATSPSEHEAGPLRADWVAESPAERAVTTVTQLEYSIDTALATGSEQTAPEQLNTEAKEAEEQDCADAQSVTTTHQTEETEREDGADTECDSKTQQEEDAEAEDGAGSEPSDSHTSVVAEENQTPDAEETQVKDSPDVDVEGAAAATASPPSDDG